MRAHSLILTINGIEPSLTLLFTPVLQMSNVYHEKGQLGEEQQQFSSIGDILTFHRRRSTGVNNKINDG